MEELSSWGPYVESFGRVLLFAFFAPICWMYYIITSGFVKVRVRLF